MTKIVYTPNAPEPIGPYSQAIQCGGFVFTSGQIALDCKTGEVVGKDVAAQTKKVMENLEAVLKAAGSGMDQVVKTTLFIRSMAEFSKINEIYGTYFKKNPPARSTVEVSCLPKNVLVEIEAIAKTP